MACAAVDPAEVDGTDDDSAEDELRAGRLPAAVGYVVRDVGFGPSAWCGATLIAPNRAVTARGCSTSEFVTPGGRIVRGQPYFARPQDVYDTTKWVPITAARSHQFTTVLDLGRSVPGVAPLRPAGPLGLADVGKTLISARRSGGTASVDLIASSTVLKATEGQGMQAIYPTFTDFVNAKVESWSAQREIDDGPRAKGSNSAPAWQRPLLKGYEVISSGANELAMTQLDPSENRGMPLLRRAAHGRYEFVGLYKDSVQAAEGNAPAVLASYYVTFAPDTLEVFAGTLPASERHCGDVPWEVGECRNGWALACGSLGASIDLGTFDSAFCGKPANCVVKPYGVTPSKSWADCRN